MASVLAQSRTATPTSSTTSSSPNSISRRSQSIRHSAQLTQPNSGAANGDVLYHLSTPFDCRPQQPFSTPAFPTPHIRPRQRRPHTIHIVSYPPGYIPTELRSLLLPPPDSADPADPADSSDPRPVRPPQQPQQRPRIPKKSSRPNQGRNASKPKNRQTLPNPPIPPNSRHHSSRSTYFPRKASTGAALAPTTSNTSIGSRALDKLLSVFIAQTSPLQPATPDHRPRKLPPNHHTSSSAPAPQAPSRTIGFLNLGRRLSPPYSFRSSPSPPPPPPLARDEAIPPTASIAPMTRGPVAAVAADAALHPDPHNGPPTGFHSNHSSHSIRNSFMAVRSAKSAVTSSVAEVVEKPVATASGLSCSIILAEPNIFLTGFDHDGRSPRGSNNGTALLRGKLQLHVTKNSKIKAVTLKLHGKARTEWPEGIPPMKLDLYEEESLRTQALTFFHAMHESWETPYGNQCTYALNPPPESSLAASLNKRSGPLGSARSGHSAFSGNSDSGMHGLSARDIKRLSLQQVHTRSFGKGDSPTIAPVQARGYKVFAPGTFEYSFELPIDHHQLETIRLPFGGVKWELEATIERAGPFKPNLHGSKEVNIIRVPDQLSLETVEPISISRQWEDQLFYDIVISGKSFPIGGRIPIAFKLTPLAKVQIHKLKVLVTENTEYWTNNRRVTRKDPGRKILLFEKAAGKPVDPKFAGSDIQFLSGGELSPSERAEARAAAAHRRAVEVASSSSTSAQPQPLPEPSENLLGDLDLGLESYWGATEIEMNVQIPTCDQMAQNTSIRLHPDCSWRNANVFHWIKVVMRISRADPDDPTGKRRRHFEISIDSPFTVLHCLATQANTSLPRYSGVDAPSAAVNDHNLGTCGCHDSAYATAPGTPTSSVEVASTDARWQNMPMPPQAVHLHEHRSGSPSSNTTAAATESGSRNSSSYHAAHGPALSEQERHEAPRPIHLMRVPSFAPPAFDADESPPAAADILSPPPTYDTVIGTPSVDGMADYFSRLENYEHPDEVAAEDSDSDSDNLSMPARISSRGGRVNVRTPGARHGPSRSMDIERPIMPFHLSMASVLRRNAD